LYHPVIVEHHCLVGFAFIHIGERGVMLDIERVKWHIQPNSDRSNHHIRKLYAVNYHM